MKHLVSVLGAGAVLSFATPVASADEPSHTEELTPAFAASRAGGFVDLWPSRNNFATIFGAELHVALSRQILVDLSYASAFAHIGDAADAGDNMGFGNPTFGLHTVLSPVRRFHAFLGGSVTLPLLQDPNREVSNAAFYAQRIRGYYEADRFVRGHLAARLSLGMEWRLTGPLYFRGELRPVVYIPSNDRYPVLADHRLFPPREGRGGAEVMLEHALEVEGRTGVGLGFGARLQGVSMMMRHDRVQLLAEPFVSLVPRGRGLYARAGFPIALDGDLGFGLDTDKLAGARFAIGAQW